MTRRHVGWSLVLAMAGFGVGCDNGGESTSNSIAAAMGHVAKGKDEAEAKVHASERMKALREQAEAEAVQAKEAAYEALITLPEPGGDLKTSCASAVEAFDAFNASRLTGAELQRYNATKQPDLDKLGETCRGLGSAKVAACQAQAFAKAGPLFSADDAPFILSKCEERAGVTSTKTAAL